MIIPAYNAEAFLPQCLDSVLAQTEKNIEIIVINDCSSDKTKDIINEYAKKNSCIKPIHFEVNQGQSAARNAGLDAARGEYISFVDSDDFIAEDMLEKLCRKAEKTDADMVITNISLYFEDTGKTEIFRDKLYFTFLSGRVFAPCDYPPLISVIGVWDRIYKRSLIESNKLRFPLGLVYEDHLFCVQAYVLSKRITVVSEPLYFYRKNAGGSITDNEAKNDKYKFNYLEITRRIKKFLHEQGVYEQLQEEYLKYQFFYSAFHQQNISDYDTFQKFFREMKELTTESDFRVIEALDGFDIFSDAYLKSLETDNPQKAYRFLSTKSMGKKVKNKLKPKK